MTDFDIAIERLACWVRDYGDEIPKALVGDVTMVLAAAKDLKRIADENEALRSRLSKYEVDLSQKVQT